MPISSYISLTSISAISFGGAYLTFYPRNNSSTWNILGRKVAVGVMISGAIGWIIYCSFKKPPLKKKKVLPKLTTIRKRRTTKSSKSSKSSAASTTSSGNVKTKDDFISSPANVSMSSASSSSSNQSSTSSQPSMASTQISTVSKVESNEAKSLEKIFEKPLIAQNATVSTDENNKSSKVLEKKVDETLSDKQQIELPPSVPTSVLPIPDTILSKAEKIELPKLLDKKIDEPLIASVAHDTTESKVESIKTPEAGETITSFKLPETQQNELLPLPPPTVLLPTPDSTVSKVESNEASSKIVENKAVQSTTTLLDKQIKEPLTDSIQDTGIKAIVEKDLEKVDPSFPKLPEKQLNPPPPPSTVSLSTSDISVSKAQNKEATPKLLEKRTVQLPKQPEVCDCGVEAMDDIEKYSEETTMPDLNHPINFPNKTIILPMSYECYRPVNLTIPTEGQTQLLSAVMQKPEKENSTMLTPFRPILHSMYYAHRHALLIEDLLQNYQFLED